LGKREKNLKKRLTESSNGKRKICTK